jgi:hypothetical protein
MRISGSTLFAITTIVGVWASIWPRFSLPIAFTSVVVLAVMLWCDLKLGPPHPPA